jgi:hypothetical protein
MMSLTRWIDYDLTHRFVGYGPLIRPVVRGGELSEYVIGVAGRQDTPCVETPARRSSVWERGDMPEASHAAWCE